MIGKLRKYGKTVVATLAAGVVVAQQALSGDQHIDPAEKVAIVIAVLTAVGVYAVPMSEHAKWAKSAVAAILAALQVLSTTILGGVGPDEVMLMLVAAAGALGVYVAPAVTETPAGVPDVVVGVGADV